MESEQIPQDELGLTTEETLLSETLDELPPYLVRGSAWLLFVFLIAALIYSTVGQVDIIRSARATIVPEGQVKSIQPLFDGALRKLVVEEGQLVEQGQTLAIVESREVSQLLAALKDAKRELDDARHEVDVVLPLREEESKSRSDTLNIKISSLRRAWISLEERVAKERLAIKLAAETQELELKRAGEVLRRLRVEQANARGVYEFWQQELKTIQHLVDRRAASRRELQSVQRSAEEALGEIQKQDSLIREAEKEPQLLANRYAQTENDHQRQLAVMLDQLAQSQVDMQAAQSEITQLERQLAVLKHDAQRKRDTAAFRHEQARQAAEQNLRGIDPRALASVAEGQGAASNEFPLHAPVRGRVAQIHVRNPGEAVSRGATLLTIVPSNVALVMELKVSHRDVGLLKEGLPVRLKFDAFPFAEYGAINGQLTHIPPDAEKDAQGLESYYRVSSSLRQDYFLVEGKQTPLLSGMTATAEIITERKTILGLLMKPFLELRRPAPAQQ